jgi:hypothetical protein
LDDVAARRLRSEKVESVVGYLVVGAIAECPIDDSIPGSSSVVIGWSFSDVVGDPFGWLISKGCEPVAMPITDLAHQA